MIGIRNLLLAGLAVSALAACSDPKFDDSSQFGSNPVLPDPKSRDPAGRKDIRPTLRLALK